MHKVQPVAMKKRLLISAAVLFSLIQIFLIMTSGLYYHAMFLEIINGRLSYKLFCNINVTFNILENPYDILDVISVRILCERAK